MANVILPMDIRESLRIENEYMEHVGDIPDDDDNDDDSGEYFCDWNMIHNIAEDCV